MPVAALIILSPEACLILFVISLRRTVSPSSRRMCAGTTFDFTNRRAMFGLCR